MSSTRILPENIVSKYRKYLRFSTIGKFIDIICLIDTDEMVDDNKNLFNLGFFGMTVIGLTIISWYMIWSKPSIKQSKPDIQYRNTSHVVQLLEISQSNKNQTGFGHISEDHTDNDSFSESSTPTTVNHKKVSISIIYFVVSLYMRRSHIIYIIINFFNIGRKSSVQQNKMYK